MIIGKHRGTCAIIDLGAIKHNLKIERQRMEPGQELFAVVKADAYSHGLVPVAVAAQEAGVDGVCVAVIDEAVALRENGITKPILILGASPEMEAPYMAKFNLSTAVSDLHFLQMAQPLLAAQNLKLKVHLALDTGMGRIGFRDQKTVKAAIEFMDHYQAQFEFEGMFTHFATADSPDENYFNQQVQRWHQFVASLDELPPYVHMANSATGLWHREKITANTVRMGISMYGQNPSGRDLKLTLDLQPVSSLVSSISFVKQLKAGRSVSYGATYTAEQDEWLATLPIGYADGYPRCMTGYKVLVDGQFCDIAGRVCMDQMMIRLPKYYPVGTPVVLMGKSGDQEITATDLAEQAGTINYEILTNISNRVHRIYHQSK